MCESVNHLGLCMQQEIYERANAEATHETKQIQLRRMQLKIYLTKIYIHDKKIENNGR